MPRFVILFHDYPTPHFDLLLELGPVLKTWRLASEPIPGIEVGAIAIADHRLIYLDYEGPIAGGRGKVIRREFGDYEGDISGPTWTIFFRGQTAPGRALMREEQGHLRFLREDHSSSSPSCSSSSSSMA